jgi:phospholipid/cholesterol/gamma-HCH transport system permease protein
LAAVAVGYTGSYLAVVRELNAVSSAGYLAVFWQFQTPPDLLFAGAKAMVMATYVVLVGCYYGYRASGGPVGVGKAAARTMAVSIIGIQVIGILGTQLFWGANPRSPVGG